MKFNQNACFDWEILAHFELSGISTESRITEILDNWEDFNTELMSVLTVKLIKFCARDTYSISNCLPLEF
jgi:hypothetical protein